MSILATAETVFGDTREIYIKLMRLNAVESPGQVAVAQALFLGYTSEAAMNAGKRHIWEREIEIEPDKDQPLWSQAYVALTQTLRDPGGAQGAQLVANSQIEDV
jgi:hypothetical protein